MVSESEVLGIVGSITDPETGCKMVDIGELSVTINKSNVGVILRVATQRSGIWEQQFKDTCEKVIRSKFPEVAGITVVLISKKQVLPNRSRIPGVKNIILVGSSKGGVGKSTISANIALSLAMQGYKTALVDVDIYGPSIPRIIGTEALAEVDDEGMIIPMKSCGIKSISLGNVTTGGNKAVVWRGPMLTKAINKLIMGTAWGEIDYMIIDTPPGTGDVHISLTNSLVIDGAVVVSTPHGLSVTQAAKTCDMLKQLGVRILGMVENMSYLLDDNMKEKLYIFGCGGVQNVARDLGVPFLGEVKIDTRVCEKFIGKSFGLLDEDLKYLYKEITTGMLKEYAG